MTKYMLVMMDSEGQQEAHFTNEYSKAREMQMEAAGAIGLYVELYERERDAEGLEQYMLLEA